MEIKERLKRISEYFKEMQIVTVDGEQMIYVIVNFPIGWTVENDLEERFSTIVEMGNQANEFYFFTELDNEAKVFDAIEYTINKMKDAIERAELLKQKVNELKTIFQNENNSIKDLRTIKFSFTGNVNIENKTNTNIVDKNDSLQDVSNKKENKQKNKK